MKIVDFLMNFKVSDN